MVTVISHPILYLIMAATNLVLRTMRWNNRKYIILERNTENQPCLWFVRKWHDDQRIRYIANLMYSVLFFPGDRPFHCDQCNYRSITKDQLKRHIEREHENIKYVCHQCEYVAPSRTNLWHHQQKHKKPQALACPICPEKFDR